MASILLVLNTGAFILKYFLKTVQLHYLAMRVSRGNISCVRAIFEEVTSNQMKRGKEQTDSLLRLIAWRKRIRVSRNSLTAQPCREKTIGLVAADTINHCYNHHRHLLIIIVFNP